MSVNNIIQGIGKIWCRLFDHRGFLNGEINFVLKEFEEKRGDTEVDGLFNIIENITDIKDTQIDRLKQAIIETVPDIVDELDEALERCNKVLANENDPNKKIELEKNREIRRANWDKFMEKITAEYADVNSAFEAKEAELREHYSKLEQELKKVTY